MLKKLLAALLAVSSFAVLADDFYVVVPVKGKTARASDVQVSLAGTLLPGALIGSAYSYNFNQNLQITGDSAYAGNGVLWEVAAGSMPAGLLLNSSSGLISGAPTTSGAFAFTLRATYRGKIAYQNYNLNIAAADIVQANGYRTWRDGSLAASCKDYLAGSGGWSYTGATGDGVYRIQPSGHSATDVYCDMVGGGWTLVLKGVANSTTGWASTGAVNTSSLTSVAFTGQSGKQSDAFINAVKTSGYRLEGVTSKFGAAPIRFVSGACTYAHLTNASGACATTFSDSGLSQGALTQSTVRQGISDYRSSGERLTYITQTGGQWFVGTDASGQYEGATGYIPGGSGAGSSIRMWVR